MGNHLKTNSILEKNKGVINTRQCKQTGNCLLSRSGRCHIEEEGKRSRESGIVKTKLFIKPKTLKSFFASTKT